MSIWEGTFIFWQTTKDAWTERVELQYSKISKNCQARIKKRFENHKEAKKMWNKQSETHEISMN